MPSVPQLLPFAQTQLPQTQLATVPAGQGNPTFPGTPSLFFNQYPVSGPGVSIPGVRFPGPCFVASGSPSYPPAAFPSFVVGPGIPPVPPKLVAAIVSGDFIDFALLLEDHVDPDAPSFSLVADQLVIRPAKRRKEITDILTWMQAFSVYMLVLTTLDTSEPHRTCFSVLPRYCRVGDIWRRLTVTFSNPSSGVGDMWRGYRLCSRCGDVRHDQE